MGIISGPDIVEEGLVLHLDAANNLSYAEAGVIPPRSESLMTAWVSSPGQSAHHDAIGDDSVLLKNTSYDVWIGYFDGVHVAGYHTMIFDYQSDLPGTTTQVEVNDDGTYTANVFYDHVYATSIKQTFSKTATLGGSADSNFYFRRETNNSANVTISNFRLYPSDSAGNSITWNDLSGNGNNAVVETAVTFSSTNGGGLTTLNEAANSNTAIYGSFSLNTLQHTWEIWFTDNGSNDGQDCTGFGVHDGSVTSHGFRYRSLVQHWVAGTLYQSNAPHPDSNPAQIIVQRSGIYIYTYVNGAYYTSGSVGGKVNSTFTSYSMNDISRSSSGYGWNGTYYIVRMYSRALSATEIAQNYNATKTRFGL